MTRHSPRKLLKRTTTFLGLLFSVLSPAYAVDSTETLQVGSSTRTFVIHVPTGPAPRDGYPTILAFHGGGMQGAGMTRITRLDDVADERHMMVVYPDGIEKHWNDGRSTIKNPQDDVGFTAALIDELIASHHADRHRIYATGISNGALFAERLGCDLSTRIAAIAPVAGSMPREIAPACHPSRPVAVLQIDGTADPIMPYKGGQVADFGGKGEGGDVLSVDATAGFWATRNGCQTAGSARSLPPHAVLDSTTVAVVDFTQCPHDGRVSVMTVAGGGHAWPGGLQYARPAIIGLVSRQFDASEIIAEFFLGLPVR